MKPQPMIAVADVEASSLWYREPPRMRERAWGAAL